MDGGKVIADLRLGRWQDVLADVPDASVRLLLTSPPYDNARTYEGTNEPVDFGELATFALRALMPGGVLAMVLDGAVNDGEQSVTPYRVIVMVRDGAPHVSQKAKIAERAVYGEQHGALAIRTRDGSMRGKTSVRDDAFDVRHRGSIWRSRSRGTPAPARRR